MFDFQTKFKRQVEILGFCLAGNKNCTKEFLQETYGVEPLTIKRDLMELRSNGIDIHSSGRRGIELSAKLTTDKLKELLIQYLGLCYSLNFYDKPVSLMVKRLKTRSLSNIVILQKCIENHKMASILYEKEASVTGKKWRDICPFQMFESENYWRVLSTEDGNIKQFILNKILDVKALDRKFKEIPKQEIDDLFLYSWRSWLGYEKYEVRLKLSPRWAKTILPRQIMIFQDVIENPDGSAEMKLTVNSLEEIASWIVSRGEGVIVLEPVELKNRVVDIAKGTLRNYGY